MDGTFFHCNVPLPPPCCAQELVTCLTVLYGTLLKLYPLGAKEPIFTAKVELTRRIKALLGASVQEQGAFITDNIFLVKLCYMEYTLNALQDFMPCERALLLKHSAMKTYESISIAMCDNFRQDVILTGLEPWETMNKAASCAIDRCVRICKFKMLRVQVPRPPTRLIQYDCNGIRVSPRLMYHGT